MLIKQRRIWVTRIAMAVVLLLVAAGASGAWLLRRATMESAADDLQQLAIIIADNVERDVQAVDLVLQAIVEDVARLVPDRATGLVPAFGNEAAYDALKRRFADISHIESLAIADATGVPVLITRTWPVPPLNIADRDYFQHFLTNPAGSLFISRTVANRIDGGLTVFLARPLRAGDGSFAGVATAALRLSHFDQTFISAGFQLGTGITLARTDGAILMRYPAIVRPDQRIVGSEWFEVVAASGGPYRSPGRLDNLGPRQLHVRLTAGYPLAITASRIDSTVLQPWRYQVGAIAILVALGILLTIGLDRLIARQLAALARAGERIAVAVEDSGIAIWEWRIGTDAIEWDPSMYRLYGLPNGGPTFCYAQWRELLHPDDRAATEALFAAAAEGSARFNTEFRVVWADGSLHHLRANARLIRDDGGQPLRMVGVNWDVTETRRLAAERDHQAAAIAEREARAAEARLINAELERLARHLGVARDRAERASRAKSRFLANTSHELRTPLNGILGYAQLLAMRGGLDHAQTGWVSAMMGAGRHLLDMITKVLDMSAIEAEEIKLLPAETDLAPLLASCADVVRPRAEEKGLTLILGPGIDRPMKLITDAGRLRQVVINLLGNAVKFTQSGSVTLRLAESAESLRIEVADTGPGIPPDKRDRLFQEFERLESGAVEGAGLGLALSARLMVLLGGKLGQAPNPAGGSVFWLELPRDTVAAASPVNFAAPAPGLTEAAPTQSGPSLRVLVVDDVAVNRDVACAFLAMAGHRTRQASGGDEAVAAVIAEPFDVVLMDVRMPEVDGLEATRRIRALGGPRGQLPIIGLTALTFGEQIEECMAAGMDGHIAKPYSADALLTATRQAPAAAAERRGAPAPPPAPPAPLRTPAANAELLRLLPHDRILAYERDIMERSRELLAFVRKPELTAAESDRLADQLHSAAGSAGLLGLTALSNILRDWERHRHEGTVEPAFLAQLAATIETTNAGIALRQPAPQLTSA